MQPMVTLCVGMILYLGLSYLIFGIFALTDRRQEVQ